MTPASSLHVRAKEARSPLLADIKRHTGVNAAQAQKWASQAAEAAGTLLTRICCDGDV